MKTVRIQPLFFTVSVVFGCFLSCNRQSKLDEKASYIAGLECRAISLRQQRFALANQLRFAQDSLQQLKVGDDSTKLTKEIHVFTNEKDKLLQQSLQLADTIHLSLDSLRKFVFTGNDDKKVFDEKLKAVLTKNGCNKE